MISIPMGAACAFIRGKAQQRLFLPGPSLVGSVAAYWPINGFGTFNSGATFDNCYPGGGSFPSGSDDIWPNVYKTLTLSAADTLGTNTRTFQFQDCCDVPYTDTGWITAGYPQVLPSGPADSITSTLLSTNYSGYNMYTPPYSGAYYTGTMTATLSNPISAASLWAAWTANAQALISGVTIPTPGSSSGVPVYCPATSGLYMSSIDAGWLCAAALGIPVRYLITDAFGSDGHPALPTIFERDPSGPYEFPNYGGLVCVSSSWVLNGLPPYYIPDPQSNHLAIYGQKFDPAAWAMGTVTRPASYYASSAAHPNIIAPTTARTFLAASDVLATLATFDATASYGIIGFRRVPM